MAGAFSSAFSSAFDVGAVAYTLTASVGSFTLTGQTAGLLWARNLTVGQASFTLTGESVTLTYTPLAAPATGAGADSGGTTYHGDRNVLRQRYENQKALALLLTLVTDF